MPGKFRKQDERCTQYHCTDDGAYIRFKQVSTHTGYVAYIVAHVVSDSGGVQGVVFGDTGFHFSYQVGAYVRSLGVYTSTYTRKKRNRGSSERKARQYVQYLVDAPIYSNDRVIKQKESTQAQNSEPHYAQSHHRTPCEGHFQRFAE